jgi:lysophospholipase L1-like esterase
VLAVCLGLVVPAIPAGAGDPPEGPVHLALGDSQAFGFGTPRPDKLGYVAVLHRWLTAADCRDGDTSACPHLELADLTVPGATTSSLIANQLPDAIQLIGQRNNDANPGNDVIYITVTIGGNDIFNAFAANCLGGVTPGCVNEVTAAVGLATSNLAQILGTLRAAAGLDARIVVSTYDNPLGSCFLAPFESFGDLVLEGDPESDPGDPRSVGFNDLIRLVAAATGAEVADTFEVLSTDDWVGGDDCLHPDISGYHKMADVFLDVLD